MAIPVTATTNATTKITQLYVGMFGRAPDAEGLNFWGGALDGGQPLAKIAQDMFGTTPARAYFPAGSTSEEVVHSFYVNVLGRQPDSEGLAFWVARLDALKGVGDVNAVGQVVTEIISIVANYQGNDPAGVESAQLFANKIAVAEFYTSENGDVLNSAKPIALVNSDPASVNQVKAQILNGFGDIVADHTFTLKEVVVAGHAGTPDVTAVYWGYNPHNEHDETTDPSGIPADGGIPVADLVNFLTTITGLDLHELGLIDADGVTSFQNVTSLSLSNPLSNTVSGDDNTTSNELVIRFADGTVINAEVALGAQYFGFLNNLLFDANGNSRLYEKVIVEGSSGSSDSLAPIKLTPSVNNGGTIEQGYTTAGDDLIVAGRLDLLHGAYIDGGAGRNTLEVDAKGTFAQPTALLNIQEVHVNDLPNWYNNGTGGYLGDSNYPYLGEGSGSQDSYLDLSRAVDIDKLVVTAGDRHGGDLTIVGIRNGATTRLEGGFADDVNLYYGQGQTGPLTVELLLGQVTGNLNFVHNNDSLHLVSLGGSANSFGSEDIGGRLTNLKISGDASLYIRGDLDNSFQDATPVTIDASENTKGVDLELTGSETVTFMGSVGDDSFKVQTSDASDLVAGNPDDSVTIVDTSGNNHYAVESTTIAVTVGNGNNNIELDGQFAQVAAGNGNNTVVVANGASFETIAVTVGNGNNTVNTDDSETVSITAGNGVNLISSVRGESVTIVAGDGGNKVTVSAETIDITTGAGNDTITVSGMGSTDIGGDANTTALLNIDTGAGNNTVVLGRDLSQQLQFGITALEGSSITGQNITLKVENLSDLRAATLDGIEHVVLNYDISSPINANVGNYALAPVLTLTDTQFAAIGAANFAVQGAVFSNYAQIKIIVTSSTSLTALGVDSLPRNLDLQLEVQDGVTLTMTAQQLHTKVAPGGITLDLDNNTDTANGKVVITGGGADFDPFNNSDTIKTNIDGTVYYGGSLSNDFLTGGKWYNVTVKSLVNGWDRPADVAAEVVITLDSTGTAALEQGAFSSWHTNLAIIGDQDINFTGDFQLGMEQGTATNPFTIDFSELEGVVNNFTVDNFELLGQGGGIHGNSNNGYASEVHISLAKDTANDGVGFDESDAGSLVSTGVTRYVVTTIDGPTANGSTGSTATIKLCDTAQDIEVFALRGNYNDTLIVQDAAWGLVFELQGGGTAKAEGPTGTSNVGKLVANYEWEHAAAVVNIVHSVAGDVRPIHVEGIDIDNADTLAINVTGSATIDTLATQDAESLTVDATGNVAFVDALALGTLDTVDASGVVGTFAVTLEGAASGDSDFHFTGSTAGSSLTLLGVTADNGAADGTTTTIDGGVGGVTLTIGNGTATGNDTVDLSAATLTNVDGVVLTQGSDLTLTIAQAGDIGAANFSTPGTATATLHLTNLDDTLFVKPAFASDITVGVVDVAPLPVVTLNPGTDLTGIGSLAVHEGTTLNLTAAQFQQLTAAGTINLLANPNIVADTVINITDLTAADVAAGFDTSLIGSGFILNLELAESVNLSNLQGGPAVFNLAGVDSITYGDGITLTLGDVQQANGVDIIGGVGSVLTFTDTSAGAFESINASGFDVTELHMLNVLIDGRNVDLLFSGLAQSITKVIYNDLGWVEGVTQTVSILEGTTVPGFVVFNKPEDSVEIQHFVLNLQGGTDISSNLRLSTSLKDGDLIQTHLQTVVINSTGTGANLLTGSHANVIHGDLTSQGTGNQGSYVSVDNNLLNVTINADQAFTLTGDVVFESVTGDDAVTANDDPAAIATLTVTGTADVTLGGLNTQDDDVDGLVLTNNGTGTVHATLDAADIDQAVGNNDALQFLGSNIELTTVGAINLSDDVITGVSAIHVTETGALTLSYPQLQSLGVANVTVVDGPDAGTAIGNAALTINGYNGGAFDATTLDTHFDTVNLVLVNGDVTLGAGVNLTNVDSIVVQEGHTLTLTAAQFQQLQGAGTITAFDTNGAGGTDPIHVVITGLTQADVDAGFDLTGVSVAGGDITISLGEPSVDLGTFDSLGVLVPGSDAVLNGAQFVLAANETLGLVNFTQANGLDVAGGANSTIVYKFVDLLTSVPGPVQIDASGYNVTVLKALAASFSGVPDINVEFSIDDLPSSVSLHLYADPADLGFLDPTFRVVVIEENITTPVGLIFNDWDTTDEVRTLDLTLQGGVILNGDLAIPTRTDKVGTQIQRYFDTLTIHSEGAAVNTINGNISTGASFGATTANNNLLNVNIIATQDMVIVGGGTSSGNVVFSYNPASNLLPAAQVAKFSITGSADVTVDRLDVSDGDIVALAVANNGTGLLTVTGSSPAIFDNEAGSVGNAAANLETLTFTGTGDIVIGDADSLTPQTGIDLANLSTLDASGLSGDLSLGEITNIDSASFAFTSGTGVTSLTLTDAVFAGYGADNAVGGTGLNADGSGWSFDFSGAAAGSAFHLNAAYTNADVGVLNIDLGANTTLYIDQSMDLTGMDLTILQTQNIVLADGATLTLTADQANGLHIVAGPDTGTAGIDATVNIINLTNDTDPDNPADAFDLSGIAQNIAGTITFKSGTNDVTLDKMTDLGFFSVTLNTIDDTTATLAGQTIRFQNVDQAERVVIAAGDSSPGNGNSANVVWLFDNITAPVDTRGYFSTGPADPVNKYATAYTIGRLWMTEALINNEGGDVEQLFTTLPLSILRVDFTTLTALNVLLSSASVDRVVEMVHFTNLNDLTFSDVGLNPIEHLHSLTLDLGGQVTIGNININDVVGAPGYDPASVTFTALTINSKLALHQDNLLASEFYVNNDNGVDEIGENVQPNAVNTIGNISVGAGLDLLTVNINTFAVAAIHDGTVHPNDGAVADIGTITYGARTPATPTVLNAKLNVTGNNNVNITSVVVTDADITGPVTVDLTGFTATLTAPGASPAFVLGAQIEELVFTGGTAGLTPSVVNLGSDDVLNPNAGISGAGLSHIDASGYVGTLNLGILALIDGTNDDDPLTVPVDTDIPAFELTSGSGITTATLGKDPDSANVPTLAAGSEWIFDFTNAAAGSRLTITDDVVFGAPALPGDPLPKLTLTNVDLFIQGDVDLTGVDLITGTFSDIFVPAGNTLTLTYAQAAALGAGVDITGEGTVHLVGEVDTDAPVTLDVSHIHTVGVDLSGITMDPGSALPQLNVVYVDLPISGALSDANPPVAMGFNVIGSSLNDEIEGSILADTINGGAGNDVLFGDDGDDILTGGLGDDALTGGAGSDTFNVTAGTDTITDLKSVSTVVGDHDVLVVSAGATAEATGITAFFATADTMNNGVANLTTAAGGGTIDMSLVTGGSHGFGLTGNNASDVLIGSNLVDIINGGNLHQVAGQVDTLTGNGGGDFFVFNVDMGNTTTLSSSTTVANIDREAIQITAGAGLGGNVDVDYTINGNPASVSVAVTAGMTAVQVATAIANQLQIGGAFLATATAGGTDTVTVTSQAGYDVELTGITPNGTGVTAAAPTEGTDVAQEVTLTAVGNPTAGDQYSVAVTLNGGGTILATYNAVLGDTADDVLAGLAADFNTNAGANTVDAVNASLTDGLLKFVDENPDNGGFSLATDLTAAFGGSGASNGTDYTTADIITDFVSGVDKVVFATLNATDLQAGSGANYLGVAVPVADAATAVLAASTAFTTNSGTLQYYFTSVTDIDGNAADFNGDGNNASDVYGMLFFDANLDGTADGVILLAGVTAFSAFDIQAS